MISVDGIMHRALAALIPPPRLNLADWIEENLVLPADVSAIPGRVRLHAYQRGIAEAISDPNNERVTLVKPVRVGATFLLNCVIANYAANEPSPIMLLLPTESDCRDHVVSDLEPTFNATPALQGLLDGDNEEGGRNTLTSRRFPSGTLKVIAAKAPRNLRRHNIRILLCDEIDAMEIGPEGNPVTLAIRRTLSFANRKIICASTPTIEETSNILRLYAEGDCRVFEVPCPACGAFTFIEWRHIAWEPDHPETAKFRCPHCNELIDERHKPEMVENGVWRVTKPEIKGHASFKLNALVSPLANASWGRLAAEFLRAKEHPDQLMVFVNTYLAEGWRESEAGDIDQTELQARVEPFGLPDRIPPEILLVTAGTDVQDDRLVTTILGWSRDEILILAHSIVWGSVHEDSTWQELDDLLRSTWKHEKGGTLKIDAAIIDSSDNTNVVYGFCRPRFNRRIYAGKGVAGTRPIVEASKPRTGVPRLFLLGVDQVKAEIMTRLSRGRTIRFSQDLQTQFFEELTSERRVIRYRAGSPYRSWERIGMRAAEGLDSTVYAWCARQLVGINLDRREAELQMPDARLPPIMPTTIQSAWLSGR